MSSAMNSTKYKISRRSRLICGGAAVIALLAGCNDGQFSLPKFPSKAPETAAASAQGGRTVERDVEAPEIFSANEQGLWDGRPSLGGVWVAHPDVDDPERVIIRNEANGRFVVGALFRREREIPGPKLQISSDAAAALGILAGAPAPLNVTALKREEVAEELPAAETDPATLDEPADVTTAALDPITAAGAAIDASPATPAATTAPEPQPESAAPKPTPKPASSLAKPFIQIGIFSVEDNANRTAKQMRGAGLVPTVKQQEANGKPFWRVLVGPATSKSELKTLLGTIKGEGFTDAYAVSN